MKFNVAYKDQIETNESKQSQDTSIYPYWRLKILYSSMIGYALFYLVRQNFTMAIPYLQKDLGFSKTEVGLIISTAAVIYGLGKWIFGAFGDKSNARLFMSIGLLMSGITTIFLGFCNSLPFFIIFWSLNSCFQSMGWPSVARLLTHWFSAKELATKWAIWNTSQQIGGACVLLLAPLLISYCGWRYVFFVPAFIVIVMSFFLFKNLRDTPQSLGLPTIEKYHGLNEDTEDQELSTKEILFNKVLKNKLVWYVSIANFFVYIVRMFVFNWAPTFLQEFKGSSLKISGLQAAAFDIAGMLGGIVAGYMSDKYFKGYRGRVGVLCMSVMSLAVLLLWVSPKGVKIAQFLGMALIGLTSTGPQILVGVAAADFASKRAAGAASGFTGTIGYLGTAVSGILIGTIVDKFGWNAAFATACISSVLGAIFFSLTWNNRSKLLD